MTGRSFVVRSTSFLLSVSLSAFAAATCGPTGEGLIAYPSGGSQGTGGSPETGGARAPAGEKAGGAKGAGGAPGRDGGRDFPSGSGGTAKDGGLKDAAKNKADTGGTPTSDGGGACSEGPPLSGGTAHCSSTAQGSMSGGFQWSVWSSGGGGCIYTYNSGCAFKATWNNSGDFLARAGYSWNSTQTYDQMGTITADFAFTKSGNGGSYNYIGIYGWSKSPLVEFYIVDDWYTKPNPGSKVGTITVEGDSYTVYKNYRTGAPSIEGTSNFDQFYSVRQTARQVGHINLTEHFDGWAKLGLKLGKMYEAKVLAEAGGGSGTVDFSCCNMTTIK
jgi:endo-1,4-beta-xylanase